MSFISIGPGTQIFVMRGVSDGSNPNYANTSATGFFVDDMSMSWYGVQPDLHLYDIERIEVLNGPQGTTFGAGAMAGAVRYITNKPDVHAFSAGVDFDGGKIQGGRAELDLRGLPQCAAHRWRARPAGCRPSAISHGGFINNQLTTRTWVNGTVSTNAAWARNDYNREHDEGGRIALKGVIDDRWSATLTYSYQRQSALGAWDEDPATAAAHGGALRPGVARLRSQDCSTCTWTATSASATWCSRAPTGRCRRGSRTNTRSTWRTVLRHSAPPRRCHRRPQEGFTCLNDPSYGSGATPTAAATCRCSSTSTTPTRSAGRTSCA